MKNKVIILGTGIALLGVLIFSLTFLHNENTHEMNHGNHLVMINSERDFIEHMIPHHREAVVTAMIVKEKGGTLRPVRDLVESIIESQTTEIEEMESWYSSWYGAMYEDVGMYEPMMRELTDLSGAELDKVFLEDMIAHHEMAVVVAKKTLELQTRPEVQNMATKIISAQEKEIYLMKDLLKLFPHN